MSAEEEKRRNLRSNLFGVVGELSDLEYQRATWLDRDMQNPHFSFVEFFECFYDAAGGAYESSDSEAPDAPLAYLVQSGVISAAERDAIWPLHVALRDYSDPSGPYDQEAILNDPRWHEVCRSATKARSDLLAIVEPAEQAYLENTLPTNSEKRWPD